MLSRASRHNCALSRHLGGLSENLHLRSEGEYSRSREPWGSKLRCQAGPAAQNFSPSTDPCPTIFAVTSPLGRWCQSRVPPGPSFLSDPNQGVRRDAGSPSEAPDDLLLGCYKSLCNPRVFCEALEFPSSGMSERTAGGRKHEDNFLQV